MSWRPMLSILNINDDIFPVSYDRKKRISSYDVNRKVIKLPIYPWMLPMDTLIHRIQVLFSMYQ